MKTSSKSSSIVSNSNNSSFSNNEQSYKTMKGILISEIKQEKSNNKQEQNQKVLLNIITKGIEPNNKNEEIHESNATTRPSRPKRPNSKIELLLDDRTLDPLP